MRALVLTSGEVTVQNSWPEPDVAGSDEAVIRIRLAGVCATDLEIVKGYRDFSGVLGHEWVGTVEAGPAALLGRRVVGEINCPCRQCEVCRAGRSNHCPYRTVLGIHGRDGAFADRLALPVQNLHVVPETVPDEAAVFVEPLAAAASILEQVHVRPSDRVVVLGVGRLGQLCCRVLALTGAQVSGVGRSRNTLDLLPVGVAPVPLDEAEALSTADIVVDCTGSPAGLALATRIVRPRGTVVMKSTTTELHSAGPTDWVVNEVTLVGSRCGPFAPALSLLERGLIDPLPLISDELPLREGLQALRMAQHRGVLKVLIRP